MVTAALGASTIIFLILHVRTLRQEGPVTDKVHSTSED